ncbi:hypothetical protein PR003_g12616 [Phytophthora rubi]|uniref:BED-type domain-containing protein n=1 Tax=Phytophthora rubi TaxID=129364 RepID=A0A6A4EZQ3_9STRA|nr:hypothetical protein PR003_g12616 [Phytophthora rubi]
MTHVKHCNHHSSFRIPRSALELLLLLHPKDAGAGIWLRATMGGGRPRSSVWTHFVAAKNAECKRCKEVITNAKVEKLERRILKYCAHWSARERSVYVDTAAQRSQRPGHRSSFDSTTASSAGDDGSSSESTPMTQEEFNKSVANYIYSSGLPLRTVEKPGFQTFSLKGLPAGLKVPSRQLVSGCLLFEAADEEVELFVEDMKDLPYIVLVIDGCTSVSHWKMMNYVIFGRNIKPVVWKIVVTEENSQTAEYIASVTMDVVNEVEHAFGKVGFVTGVMSDNVNAMQAACEILETKHGLICAGCGAHTLNLLLQDIAKLPTVKDVTEKAVRLATYFIFARKLIRAKFEKSPDDFVDDDLDKSLEHVRTIAARLNFSKEQQDAAYREATIFVNAKWDAIRKGEGLGCKSAPLEWWGLKRNKCPSLSQLARRVFSMPTSSAAAERSWSTYKYIHNKLRNRLLSDTAMKLVFVYNCRLAWNVIPDAVYDQSTLEDWSADKESGDEDFPGCDAERWQPEVQRNRHSGSDG